MRTDVRWSVRRRGGRSRNECHRWRACAVPIRGSVRIARGHRRRRGRKAVLPEADAYVAIRRGGPRGAAHACGGGRVCGDSRRRAGGAVALAAPVAEGPRGAASASGGGRVCGDSRRRAGGAAALAAPAAGRAAGSSECLRRRTRMWRFGAACVWRGVRRSGGGEGRGEQRVLAVADAYVGFGAACGRRGGVGRSDGGRVRGAAHACGGGCARGIRGGVRTARRRWPLRRRGGTRGAASASGADAYVAIRGGVRAARWRWPLRRRMRTWDSGRRADRAGHWLRRRRKAVLAAADAYVAIRGGVRMARWRWPLRRPEGGTRVAAARCAPGRRWRVVRTVAAVATSGRARAAA
jgi:phage-related protein